MRVRARVCGCGPLFSLSRNCPSCVCVCVCVCVSMLPGTNQATFLLSWCQVPVICWRVPDRHIESIPTLAHPALPRTHLTLPVGLARPPWSDPNLPTPQWCWHVCPFTRTEAHLRVPSSIPSPCPSPSPTPSPILSLSPCPSPRPSPDPPVLLARKVGTYIRVECGALAVGVRSTWRTGILHQTT